MSWKGRAEKKDGTKMTRLTRLQLEVETILIGLMQTEGWSSRVQADKIVEFVAKTVTGDRVPGVPGQIKPWEALNYEDADDIWEAIGEKP